VKVASVAEVKAHFSAYLKASGQGPVVVTRKGKPVAVLLAAGDKEELERLLMAHSPKLQAILNAARARFRSGAGISHETFWREVEAENASRGKKGNSVRKNGRSTRRN
jgi:prevent-host-death family protein